MERSSGLRVAALRLVLRTVSCLALLFGVRRHGTGWLAVERKKASRDASAGSLRAVLGNGWAGL